MGKKIQLKRQAVWATFTDVLDDDHLMQVIHAIDVDYSDESMAGLIRYVKLIVERHGLAQKSVKSLYTALYTYLNTPNIALPEDPLQEKPKARTFSEPLKTDFLDVEDNEIIEDGSILGDVELVVDIAISEDIDNKGIDDSELDESDLLIEISPYDDMEIEIIDDEVERLDDEMLEASGLPIGISSSNNRAVEIVEDDEESDNEEGPMLIVFSYFVERILFHFSMDDAEFLEALILLVKTENAFSDADKVQIADWSQMPDFFQWELATSQQAMIGLIRLFYTVLCDFLGPVDADELFHTAINDCEQLPESKSFNPKRFL